MGGQGSNSVQGGKLGGPEFRKAGFLVKGGFPTGIGVFFTRFITVVKFRAVVTTTGKPLKRAFIGTLDHVSGSPFR